MGERMISFPDLVASARKADGSFAYDMPDSWRQGRTSYGGLSVAMAYQAALGAGEDLPPLRSAQVAFIGPVGASARVEASLLRRGKSSAFVEAKLISNDGLAMTATFLFMAERASPVRLDAPHAQEAPKPEDAAAAMRGKNPAYRDYLEYRHGATTPVKGKPELLRWVRFKERTGLDPVSELLLIGDSLPPGVIPMFDVPPMASSALWSLHFPTADIDVRDGWWLVQALGTSAVGGISNQSMSVWNSAGQAMLTGSQTLSIF